jgi:thioredoxin 1
MSEHAIEITDLTFDQLVNQSDKPVVVDFWAPWCGPCRAVAPILDELAGEYADKITIGKVNADENVESVTAAGVVSIPTMNVYVGGKIVKSIVGAKPKPGLLEELAEFLN